MVLHTTLHWNLMYKSQTKTSDTFTRTGPHFDCRTPSGNLNATTLHVQHLSKFFDEPSHVRTSCDAKKSTPRRQTSFPRRAANDLRFLSHALPSVRTSHELPAVTNGHGWPSARALMNNSRMQTSSAHTQRSQDVYIASINRKPLA